MDPSFKKSGKGQRNYGQLIAKVQNLLLVSVCSMLFFRQSLLCIIRFLSDETTVSLQIQSTSEVTFPAITICPAYESAYKTNVLSAYGLTMDEFRRNFTFPKNITEHTAFFLNATFNLNELIWAFYVDANTNKNGTPFNVFWYDSVPTDHSKDAANQRKEFLKVDPNDFTTQHYNIYGRCYTYNVPDWLRRLKISNVEFFIYRDAHVFLHHPGQFSHSDSKSKLPIKKGDKFYIDIIHEMTNSLDRQLQAYDGSMYQTCHKDMNSQFDNCINREVSQRMNQTYNCTSPLFPYLGNQSLTDISIAGKLECKLNNFSMTDKEVYRDTFLALYQDGVRNDVCMQPCSTMAITYGFPTTELNATNYARIKLYFKSNVQVSDCYFSYCALSMLADLGGYIGLLLGYSCKDIAVFIETFINKCKGN